MRILLFLSHSSLLFLVDGSIDPLELYLPLFIRILACWSSCCVACRAPPFAVGTEPSSLDTWASTAASRCVVLVVLV